MATYKQLANVTQFIANNNPDVVALAIDALGYKDVTAQDITEVADKQAARANAPKPPRKPTAEMVRNRAICDDILAEFNVRKGEYTASELADIVVDPDGMTMGTRKIAALLSQMVKRGELVKSPYKWASSHYALPGHEFTPKPVRKSKKKATADETDETNK